MTAPKLTAEESIDDILDASCPWLDGATREAIATKLAKDGFILIPRWHLAALRHEQGVFHRALRRSAKIVHKAKRAEETAPAPFSPPQYRG